MPHSHTFVAGSLSVVDWAGTFGKILLPGDRFVAERLHPALRRAGVTTDPGMRHVEFEVGELDVAAAFAPSGS